MTVARLPDGNVLVALSDEAHVHTLARRQGGRLASFDPGLAALHPDVVDLIG